MVDWVDQNTGLVLSTSALHIYVRYEKVIHDRFPADLEDNITDKCKTMVAIKFSLHFIEKSSDTVVWWMKGVSMEQIYESKDYLKDLDRHFSLFIEFGIVQILNLKDSNVSTATMTDGSFVCFVLTTLCFSTEVIFSDGFEIVYNAVFVSMNHSEEKLWRSYEECLTLISRLLLFFPNFSLLKRISMAPPLRTVHVSSDVSAPHHCSIFAPALASVLHRCIRTHLGPL